MQPRWQVFVRLRNMRLWLQEEHNNMPARVAIFSLPDKSEIRAKSLFMVHEVHMYWHEQSKYLAVHVRSPLPLVRYR